jgi:ribonucleoside-diphosphate reductase alpha chain
MRGPVRDHVRLDTRGLADLEIAMHNRTFIPAGNTLVCGQGQKLMPNCSVLHEPKVSEVVDMWTQNIGFGTCVVNMNTNPVDLMKRYQASWQLYDPVHRPRRGNMFVYPVDGKYILEFIRCKQNFHDADSLSAFNISVAANSHKEIPNDILTEISKSAWSSGDPGVVFMDRVNSNVPVIHKTRKITTLVPCGEQGMFDGETCTLGSINLNADSLSNFDGTVNREKLAKAVRLGVRFLDGAVTAINPKDPYRRIGLGVMGWADVLERMCVKYGSSESVKYARELSVFFGACARLESARMAAEYSTFPAYSKKDMYANEDMIIRDMTALPEHAGEIAFRRYKLRNVSVTCLPPTGGITLLTENEGFSIEPFFRDATKLAPEHHIDMADAWQTGICNSVSKTVNIAHNSSWHDIDFILKYANMCTGLKAVSVYRDGSRKFQPVVL